MRIRAAVLEDMGRTPPYATSRPLTVSEVELAPPGRGEFVAAASPAAHHRPAALDESGSFQSVQCGVDRAGGQVEGAPAVLTHRLDDRTAMPGTVLQHGQQQPVQMSLQRFGPHT